MVALDLSRLTTGLLLPTSLSNEIWQTAQETSAVMKLARQMDLPGNGASVSVISGDAVADWVDETDEKPVSRPSIGNKTISAYTVALIVPFSNQLRRDANALYNALVSRLPAAIGTKFDRTVYGIDAAPGSNFDQLTSATAVSINTAGSRYGAVVTAMGNIAAAGGDPDGVALSTQGKFLFLSEVDADGRPMFTTGPNSSGLLGPAGLRIESSKVSYVNPGSGPDVVGYVGDWQGGAVWGSVSGINVSLSDQATITDGETVINLWQRNMFALRVEAELGFRLVYGVNRFNKLTGAVTA